tara:strand:+ start:17 stop:316 length:300 start_codon:yes stop_codon:yes gene_type:complete
VQIITKKHFNEIIKSLTEEILDEEDLEEMTSTSGAPGYNTPKAFGKTSKKKKKNLEKQTGYKFVSEAVDDKDLKVITKLIRNVVGDILRDIWLKRTAWK